MFLIISCVLLVFTFIFYIYRQKYNYWKVRKVPYLKPLTIFGNYKDFILMKVYYPLITTEICKQYPDAPYIGVYYGTEPALVIKDPELIKLITTKDFNYFNGREVCDYSHREVITQNIFFTQGERWKVLRQNLSPLFSSIKIKNMFYLLKKCATELETLLDKECEISPTMDMRALTCRFSIDSIMLCVFGINSNVMGDEVQSNPFRLISKEVLKISLVNGIKNFSRSLWPRIFYALGFKIFSNDVNDFFSNLLKEVFEKREYKPSSRHDFVDLLLSLYQKKTITCESFGHSENSNSKIEMDVTDDLLIGQCVAFFAGGFDTSTTAITLVLYELAKHNDVQKRALADVDAYLLRHKNAVEYDIVNEVPYLDACLNETLRLHPLLGVITRETMEQYTLPDGLVLDKGLRIHIPVHYLHLNPDHFEDPEKYDPERFLDERYNNIKAYTYFPFGVGPRICIGMRFAKLLVLTGLVTILKKYRVELADGMPLKLKYEPKALSVQPVEKVMLTLTPRN